MVITFNLGKGSVKAWSKYGIKKHVRPKFCTWHADPLLVYRPVPPRANEPLLEAMWRADDPLLFILNTDHLEHHPFVIRGIGMFIICQTHLMSFHFQGLALEQNEVVWSLAMIIYSIALRYVTTYAYQSTGRLATGQHFSGKTTIVRSVTTEGGVPVWQIW